MQDVAIRWYRKEEHHINRTISSMSEKHGADFRSMKQVIFGYIPSIITGQMERRLAPVDPHAERSGENLAEGYGCTGGAVAGYHC